MHARWWPILVFGVVACGADHPAAPSVAGDAAVDGAQPLPLEDAVDAGAAEGGDASRTPSLHTPLPLLRYRGGAILAAPQIVTVTFPGDPLTPRLEAFGDALLQTAWWKTVASGYCAGTACVRAGVGGGAGGGHVVFAAAPKGRYSATEVSALVAARVLDGTFPPPAAGTIYALFFPAGVSLADGVRQSCVSFTGYHSFVRIAVEGGAPVPVAYAAVARCAPTESTTTTSAARQILNAATDPYGDAYATDDEAWGAYFLTEAADLCVAEAAVNEGGFALPRAWSNPSAAAGHDPCAPLAVGEAYFNASPAGGLVSLAPGESATLEVQPFADRATTDWALTVVDYDELAGSIPTLALSLDEKMVNDGTKVKLTVTLVNPPPERGFGLYALVSRRGNTVHYWPGRILPK